MASNGFSLNYNMSLNMSKSAFEDIYKRKENGITLKEIVEDIGLTGTEVFSQDETSQNGSPVIVYCFCWDVSGMPMEGKFWHKKSDENDGVFMIEWSTIDL